MTAILFGDVKVEADRFGMADVQIAIRFGRKAGDNAAAVFTSAQVVLDDVADEIGATLRAAIVFGTPRTLPTRHRP